LSPDSNVLNRNELIEAAYHRDESGKEFDAAVVRHNDVQQEELDQRAYGLESVASEDILNALGNMGFLWSLVARVVGVSPTAVRKWRRGEQVSPAYHQSLAEFLAFCQFVGEVDPRIQNGVPYWLETPVVSETTLTRLDLYLMGHRIELLNIAAERLTSHAALDKAVPNWSEKYARDNRFRTVFDDEGVPTIVMSSGDGLGGGE
jgi:hypothetical protein